MKTKLLFLLSLLFVININAQSWDMLKPSKTWNILQIAYYPDLSSHITETDIVKFEGDTLINDTIYKKVWQTNDSSKINWGLIGYVREVIDTALYFRNLENKENLLYKYNLNIGDTLIFEYEPEPFVVINIDSIEINGEYKKRYYFSSCMNEIWIEGIGSMAGVLQSGHTCVVGGRTNLLCYYEDETLSYDNIDYSYCFYNPETSIHKVLKEINNLTIYPNPTHDILNIKAKKESNIFIFNANGILIEIINIPSLSEFQLNVKNYPKGIYFISSSKYWNSSLKFIKE